MILTSVRAATPIENAVLAGAAGDDTAIVGNWSDDGGVSYSMGEDTISGGAGSDVFVFAPSNGSDILTDFKVGDDTIDVQAVGFLSVAAVQDAMTEDAGGVVIDMGGATLLLENHTIASLTAADIIV